MQCPIVEKNKVEEIKRELRLLSENSYYGIDTNVSFRNMGLHFSEFNRKCYKPRGLSSSIIYYDDYEDDNEFERYLCSTLQMLYDPFRIYGYSYYVKKEAVKKVLDVENAFKELPSNYPQGLIFFKNYIINYSAKLKKLVSTIFILCRKPSHLDLLRCFSNRVMFWFYENFIKYVNKHITEYDNYILIYELLLIMKSITVSDFMSSNVLMDAYISAFLYVNDMKPYVSKKEQIKKKSKFTKSAKYLSEDIIFNGCIIK